MKDIEVGEYVRTKEGEIHKVIKIIEDDGDWDYYCCGNNVGYFAMDIANHSKHLIDLIECGDIIEIRTGLHSSFKYFVENEDDLLLLKEQVKQFWNIEKILTHEQFETNCYEIKEEE